MPKHKVKLLSDFTRCLRAKTTSELAFSMNRPN